MMTSAFAELGPYLSDDWEEWQDEAPDMDDVVVKEGDILGITCTGKMYNTDQSRLVERGKKLIADMEGRVREFNGPFKDILASMYYTYNPNNGDMLELFMLCP